MKLEHLSPSSTPEDVVSALRRDGAVIVDHLVAKERMAAIQSELAPWLEATKAGPDNFTGQRTRRTGGLVARSPLCRELVMHPLALGATRALLEGSTSIQLHLTQVIAIEPGERGQTIHRDQWAFDFFPFPLGYEVQCNTIWAMTDFTEANGATRIVPGSHRLGDGQRFSEADTIAAAMEQGSVVFYTGGVYHGGGTNRSQDVRMGINLTYARSWLRQEENQYLSVPLEIARTLPADLLRLIGYGRGAYALGYVDDLRDALDVVRPGASSEGFGDLERANQQARAMMPGRE